MNEVVVKAWHDVEWKSAKAAMMYHAFLADDFRNNGNLASVMWLKTCVVRGVMDIDGA